MNKIFVDTSALIALGNKRDAFHQAACRVNYELQRRKCHLVTTMGVMLEFGNAFSYLQLRPTAIKLIEAIRESEQWTCMTLDEKSFHRAFERFKRVRDKEWGLVDCLSMIAAKKCGIVEIFTTDHHFEQAGFTILLPHQ